MDIYLKVINCRVCISMSRPPVSDSVNYLAAIFEFDEEWTGYTKTAVFADKKNSYAIMLGDDNKCVIPYEVLQGKYFTVSVFGLKEDVRITATELTIPLDKSGFDRNTLDEPALTVYEEILQQLKKIGTLQDYEHLANIVSERDGMLEAEKEARKTKDEELSKGKVDKAEGYGLAHIRLNKYTPDDGTAAPDGRVYDYHTLMLNKGNGVGGLVPEIENAPNSIDIYDADRVDALLDSGWLKVLEEVSKLQQADRGLSAEIDEKIIEAKSIIPKRYLVEVLPAENIDINGTYLVLSDEPNEKNLYTEYMYINDTWEIIGNPFEVDLSGYVTHSILEQEAMARQEADEDIYNKIGDTEQLQAENKATIVGAVNEMYTRFDDVALVQRLIEASITEGTINAPANASTVIHELTGPVIIMLGDRIQGYDNEWTFTVTQGAAAQTIALPDIHWGLGIAPAFSANTTTQCRLYYVGEALCGEWSVVSNA